MLETKNKKERTNFFRKHDRILKKKNIILISNHSEITEC